MSAIPPAPTAVPTWKGAWGGAWTVVYGCVGTLLGVASIGMTEVLLRGLRAGSAAVRANATEEGGDAADRLADVLDRAPAAFGASLRPWELAALVAAGLAVIAGFGVIGRSTFARRAAIALVVTSAALWTGLLVWKAVQVLPETEAFFAGVREIFEEAERQTHEDIWVMDLLGAMEPRKNLYIEAAVQVAHLAFAAFLVARLVSVEAREWCTKEAAATK